MFKKNTKYIFGLASSAHKRTRTHPGLTFMRSLSSAYVCINMYQMKCVEYEYIEFGEIEK